MTISFAGTKTIYITERIHEYSTDNCSKCSQASNRERAESTLSLSESRDYQQRSVFGPAPNYDLSQRREQSSWKSKILSAVPQSALLSGYFTRLLGRRNDTQTSGGDVIAQKEVKTVYITEKIQDFKMAQEPLYFKKRSQTHQKTSVTEDGARFSKKRSLCFWPILLLLTLLPLCAILHYTLTRAVARRKTANVVRQEGFLNQKFSLSDYPPFLLHLLNRKTRENVVLLETKLNKLSDGFVFLKDKTDLISNNYTDFEEKLKIVIGNFTSGDEHLSLMIMKLQRSINETLLSEINERVLRFERDRIEFEEGIRDQYQHALQELTQKISALEKKSCSCPQAVLGNSESRFSSSNVKSIVQKAIETYDADKTGLPDYASEPAGGSILNVRCTETYTAETRRISWWLFSLMYFDYQPRTIIQPGIAPGLCWAFKGAHGRVVIKLSTMIKVTGVTYEHIPQSIAPQGKIDSAPKKMQLLGLQTESDPRPIILANFTYEIKGKPLQYFSIPETNREVPIVELVVWSNHGHPMYTCLYRFRVHGTPILKVMQ